MSKAIVVDFEGDQIRETVIKRQEVIILLVLVLLLNDIIY